jgi:hypothetical protein
VQFDEVCKLNLVLNKRHLIIYMKYFDKLGVRLEKGSLSKHVEIKPMMLGRYRIKEEQVVSSEVLDIDR